MPNRVIKESIRTSRKINALSDFQFRVWTYLLTYVDDYGRGSADPELLKGFVFPRRKRVSESDIEKALAELAGMGCILLYEVDGESYFCFPNWGDHQRIQTKRSKFPEPVNFSDLQKSTVSHRESPSESESEYESEFNTKESSAGKPRAFVPPSVSDVAQYCREQGYHINAESFVSFYASKGWMVGKNRMKDWKRAVVTWENRWKEEHGEQQSRNCAYHVGRDL